MLITPSFLLALVLGSCGLANAKMSCDKFQIDSFASFSRKRSFVSSGNQFWLLKTNSAFNPNEVWTISELCPGFSRVDVAFWWGTAADATSCQENTYWLNETSVMLMQVPRLQKSGSKCQWCYLWSESYNLTKQDDWDKNGTLLKELTKEVEKKGCDKIKAIAHLISYYYIDYQKFITISDGRLEKKTCETDGRYGQVLPIWSTEVFDELGKVYTGLPKNKRLVSVYTWEPSSMLFYNYFVYADGNYFRCSNFNVTNQLPLSCIFGGSLFKHWDLCESVTTSTTTTTTLASSTTQRSLGTPMASNVCVLIFLALLFESIN